MISIRNRIFETNSSSTHSISIINGNLDSCDLPIENYCYDEIWEGCPWWEDALLVDLVGFCGWDDHESQNDRLAFICLIIINEVTGDSLHCVSREEWNNIMLKVYDSEQWKDMEKSISNYVNCKYVRLYQYSEGYIDHQSHYNNIQEFLNYWDIEDIVKYVFAKKVKIHFEFCG